MLPEHQINFWYMHYLQLVQLVTVTVQLVFKINSFFFSYIRRLEIIFTVEAFHNSLMSLIICFQCLRVYVKHIELKINLK